jgi:hypothetical protein
MKKGTNPVYYASALAVCLFSAILMNARLMAEDNDNEDKNNYLHFTQVPEPLQSKYLALGDRMQKPGKERISITGVLTDSSGSNDAQVVIEKGGKLRVDVSSPNKTKSLRFDGKNASKKNDDGDDDLLESMVDDLAETFFEATASGGVLMVGLRFSDGQGHLYDVYDVPMPAKGNPKHPRSAKRFFFDSKTKLLSYVQYSESKEKDAPIIETRFSDWIVVDDQRVPTTVIRKKQGNVVFTLQGKTASTAPAAEDNLFAQ